MQFRRQKPPLCTPLVVNYKDKEHLKTIMQCKADYFVIEDRNEVRQNKCSAKSKELKLAVLKGEL